MVSKKAKYALCCMVIVCFSFFLLDALAQCEGVPAEAMLTMVIDRQASEGVIGSPQEKKKYCLAILANAYDLIGEYEDWAYEDRARWDQFMMEQGYHTLPLINAIPLRTHVTESDASSIAKNEIQNRFDVLAITLSHIGFYMRLTAPQISYWQFSFTDEDLSSTYNISVHSETGSILDISSIDADDRLKSPTFSVKNEQTITYGMLDENSISEQRAVQIGKRLLAAIENIPPELVERFSVGAWCIVQMDEHKTDLWRVDFVVPSIIGDILGADFYAVFLDAKSGALFYLETKGSGVG